MVGNGAVGEIEAIGDLSASDATGGVEGAHLCQPAVASFALLLQSFHDGVVGTADAGQVVEEPHLTARVRRSTGLIRRSTQFGAGGGDVAGRDRTPRPCQALLRGKKA